MKLAITYRVGADLTGKRTRLYIPKEILDVFEELNVTLIPLVSNVGVEDLVNQCDGLILAGSCSDTLPSYYNEEPLASKCYDVDEYAYDSKILKMFVDDNKPVLGICGGHQEINVYFGGTLNQRIENHNDVNHQITLTKDSFMYDVFKKDRIDVNSYHFQCVKDVAKGFKVTAMSDDGIIEAIEMGNIIGVQWHPEVLKDINFFKMYLERFFK